MKSTKTKCLMFMVALGMTLSTAAFADGGGSLGPRRLPSFSYSGTFKGLGSAQWNLALAGGLGALFLARRKNKGK